jgi:dipeptidyl aminopeptidase/acylaminoacyl peptidase
MHRRPIHVIALATVLISAALMTSAVAQTKRAMRFVDTIELPTVQDPQLSPDGKTVLFVMDGPDWKANRRVGHIYRIRVDGTEQSQLTFGERGESSPRWSPDGRTVAFLARRGTDAHNQIYTLHIDGGEARRLTGHPTAPANLEWSRDGRAIYFLAADAKSDQEKEKERLQDDVYAFEETDFKHRHLWRAPLEGRADRITSGDFSVVDYVQSPDGTRIATSRTTSPLLEFSHLAEIWIMDAGGANARQLTSGNRVAENIAAISADNAQMLVVAAANERFEGYHNRKVFMIPTQGGAARLVSPPEATYEVTNAAFSRDGGAIYITANLGVHDQILRLDPVARQATPLTSGNHSLGGWQYAAGPDVFVFTRNTPERPAEIHLAKASGGDPARVTSVFDETVRTFALARQERITWKGQDGQTVEGILYYPVDYQAGQRYPLIVTTHGGPASSDKFGFGNEVQVYTGMGYAVLKPNYRGSTGYGDAFLREMSKGYFKQSHLDVMAGTDAVIAMGLADPAKLVKMGWSAGGHMTNKIITFTDRFKAASSGAGAANWISMYAQSDNREFRTPWFGGTPWQPNAPIDLYWNHSPLKDVARVKTPTIFLVGEEDPRVPMPQSVEMFRALRSNGVPTHLYVAPRAGHGWTELRHRLFKLQIEMEWFEKHVFNRAYTWEKVPGEEKTEASKPITAAQR